jgi:membrane-bound ClpP family serine protease
MRAPITAPEVFLVLVLVGLVGMICELAVGFTTGVQVTFGVLR